VPLYAEKVPTVVRHPQHLVWFHFRHPSQNHFRNRIVLLSPRHQHTLRVDNRQGCRERLVSDVGGFRHGPCFLVLGSHDRMGEFGIDNLS
jgi:hypothetical protein